MERRLKLRDALGLNRAPRLAAVGAGGKTTFLMELAREYAPHVLLTASTHLAVEEAAQADTHIILHSFHDIEKVFQRGINDVTLITRGEVEESRLAGLPMEWLDKIASMADLDNTPIFVEADGSRRLPVKAPAAHEPEIPVWAKEVAVCVGLSGIGTQIDSSHVHRPEILAKLTCQEPGSVLTSKTIITMLKDPAGGLKNIPEGARKLAILNQADDPIHEAVGGRIACELIDVYDTAMVTSFLSLKTPVKAVFAPTAAIILAAGRSARFEGDQKVLLDWFGEPFVRHIARTALSAHLDPVIVVAGSQFNSVKQAVDGLPVIILENIDWNSGQSTSIQLGLKHIPERVRSVIFLLADQPQVSTSMLTALVSEHRQTAAPIIAPIVEDRRANPVLFDRVTFKHLLALQGDTGGRAIFSKYQVDYLPWMDRLMLLDVDTQDDYLRLLNMVRDQYDN